MDPAEGLVSYTFARLQPRPSGDLHRELPAQLVISLQYTVPGLLLFFSPSNLKD